MIDKLTSGYQGRLSDLCGVLVEGPIETDEGDRWSITLLDADAQIVGSALYFDDLEAANEAARHVACSCGLALVLTIAGGAA